VYAVLNDVSSGTEKITPPEDRINLVFMGMGEPLLNYDNFMTAVRLLGGGLWNSRIAYDVSTAGVVPRIRDLGAEPVRPKLAISLNASNDETRAQIMPIDRKWNLAMLTEAARAFPLRRREQLTFEYVLLGGVNDAPGKCPGSLGSCSRHSREGKSDCVESWSGSGLRDAGDGACHGIPKHPDRGRGASVYSQAPRPRYLCCLRATEEDGLES